MFVWLWSTIGTFALGLFLVVRGWRGRRHGGEPRCRKCEYNLTLLDSERCPECGTKLGRRTIVHGPRRRSWTFIVIGGLVLLLGLLSVQSTLLEIQTKRHRVFPFRLLLERAESGDLQAMGELQRRIAEKQLSKTQAHRLADRALLAVGPAPSTYDSWWRRLIELDKAGLLLDGHRKRMAASAGLALISVRSEIRQGDPAFLIFSIVGSPISPPYVQRFELKRVLVGDRIVYETGEDSEHLLDVREEPFASTWGTQDLEYVVHLSDLPAGTTTLIVEGVLHFRAPWETPTTDDGSRSKEEQLEASITIVPLDEDDPVTWDEQPQLEAVLQEQLQLHVTRCSERNPCNDGALLVPHAPIERQGGFYDIPFASCLDSDRALPATIAMEVIIEAGGKELSTKWLHDQEDGNPHSNGLVWPAGIWWRWGCHTARVPVFDEDEFYIILRSSKDPAHLTLNMYSVWHGELRYGPFPVRHAEGDLNP